jgi:hypothetical protein
MALFYATLKASRLSNIYGLGVQDSSAARTHPHSGPVNSLEPATHTCQNVLTVGQPLDSISLAHLPWSQHVVSSLLPGDGRRSARGLERLPCHVAAAFHMEGATQSSRGCLD